MRKFLPVILISSLILAFVFLQRGLISTVKASPDVHQGDLILSDNDVHTIEGRFDINGSIIVEENATLILRNAILNFTQMESYQFMMTFRNPANGHPRFLIENCTITANNYYMYVDFYGNSSMEANELFTDDYIYVRLHTDSFAWVLNSVFGYMTACDHSVLIVSNSSFSGVYSNDDTSVTISDCTFGSLEPDENSEANVANSTISYLLVVESWSVNYSVIKHEPGFASYWNFHQNCSVVTAPTGEAPNVTLTDTQVGDWGFSSFGKSNVTVSSSKLFGLWGRWSSSVSVYNSAISYALWSQDSSIWHLYNTTTQRLYSDMDSKLWLVNSTSNEYYIEDWSQVFVSWYLSVHVVDSIGQDVPSANVTATYPNTTIAESKLTYTNGWAKFTLKEKTKNATGDYPVGNYSVEAKYEIYSGSTTANMTESKQISIQLPFIIPEFPSPMTITLFIITTLLAVIVHKRKHLAS